MWQFAERIIPDPNVIKLRKEELTLNNIRQYYVLCGSRKDKYQALCNIYGGITIGQAIIFCQVAAEMGVAVPRLPCRGPGAVVPRVQCGTVPSTSCMMQLDLRATLSGNDLQLVGGT